MEGLDSGDKMIRQNDGAKTSEYMTSGDTDYT